jgi:exopolysaccharide biosynthesis polyprenyl glycosylphosphotransferase
MSGRRGTVTQNFLLILQLLGDAGISLAGLSVGYWLRFDSPLRGFAQEAGDISFERYAPLILIGMVFFVSTYAYFGAYSSRLLLRPQRAMNRIMQSVALWFCIFLGVSLALKFDPPISRLFVGVSCVTTLIFMTAWRLAFYRWLSHSDMRHELTQKVLLVGWTDESAELAEAIYKDHNHPYRVVGWLKTKDEDLSIVANTNLGSLANLEEAIVKSQADMVVVCDFDLSKEELVQTATICERLYARFLVVPSFFQIFFANLRSDSVAGVPVLGISDLPVERLLYRLIKRGIDVLGALVGLLFSFPMIIWIAWRIHREDPGPVFFKQERVGQNGKLFPMFKLRSMKLGSEKYDHLAQSTAKEDSRLLKIGEFIRKWNLDEVPQFWNVLVGQMSLVGPRPEREYHAHRLAHEIPNYNTRHIAKPGMTGWAQVNGLRGEGDLSMRVKYDLYYIENWSVWFDIQIMLLTFVRRQNAY